MDAEFLAGFFDGDGYFEQWLDPRWKNSKNVRITLSQAVFHKSTLDKIASTLPVNYHWRSGQTKNHPWIQLRISGIDNCNLLFKEMSPWLIVKRDRVSDIIALKPPKEISWKYLAGFTEADGHILPGRWIDWTQSKKQDWVLDEIIMFLNSNDIHVSDYNFNPNMRRILVTRKADRKFVAKKLHPHLVSKQNRATVMVNE